jgi:hypothetical protein
MIWRSFWHIESSGIIARVLFAILVAILGSLGVYFSSPLTSAVVCFFLFLLVYRFRYKRL